MIKLTLKLFNGVLAKQPKRSVKPYISEDEGLIIEPEARWAKTEILNYYKEERLSGNDLNKTFHKSWKKIRESSRCELLIEQIKHYISTYGSDFQNEIYIPDEVLDVPQDVKIVFKVVKAYSKDELTEKCLNILRSGIALKEETVDELISLLVNTLDYTFTGKEGIRNKEVIVKLAEDYGIMPNNPVEFMRYIVYRTTGNTLLIKSPETIDAIKNSSYNPHVQFKKFGLERLAEIFNRYKPLFLAFKGRCPSVINKISKLSKDYHKPMVENPLSAVTKRIIEDIDMKFIEKATVYQLLKALVVCDNRIKTTRSAFTYRIRNGKSFVKEADGTHANKKLLLHINKDILITELAKRTNLKDVSFYIPKNVEYAIPTSEKMYVGNIPVGTSFYGKRLAVGVYWKDSWGAHDLDLSGITEDGTKVGWNARYESQSKNLLYSGDITSAPQGAVEYLYADKKMKGTVVVNTNVFSGNPQCGYKIIVGKGDNVDYDYMMNPNKLKLDVKTESVQKQTVLGIFFGRKDTGIKKQRFVLLNYGAGNVRVSGSGKFTKSAIRALIEEWIDALTFDALLEHLGAFRVDDPKSADLDFSIDVLEKDSFMKIFD